MFKTRSDSTPATVRLGIGRSVVVGAIPLILAFVASSGVDFETGNLKFVDVGTTKVQWTGCCLLLIAAGAVLGPVLADLALGADENKAGPVIKRLMAAGVGSSLVAFALAFRFPGSNALLIVILLVGLAFLTGIARRSEELGKGLNVRHWVAFVCVALTVSAVPLGLSAMIKTINTAFVTG